MNFLLVEDEALYAQQLEMLIEKLQHQICGVAESAEQALQIYDKQKPDIALIDINLKGEMNGLELGKWFKRFDEEIIIIYITSLQDEKYFEQAKEIAAFSFLTKPVDPITLQRTIELATKHGQENNKETETNHHKCLFIKNRSKLIKVKQETILYVEAEDKYCNIHLLNGKKHLERISLSNFNKKLDPNLFAQTHRSYIVNLSKVEEINSSDMTVKLDKHHLPLGDTFKEYFLKKIGVQ